MFQASFPACCRILKDAGNVICGEPAVPMQCLTVSEENQRTVKVVTVVYENYFFRTGSYASLSVVMVWSGMEDEDGTAVITAVGSGGGNGILNISWGAEEDLEAEFWSTLAARNPELIITDYQQRTILGDTEANMPFRCTAFSDEKHSEMGTVEKRKARVRWQTQNRCSGRILSESCPLGTCHAWKSCHRQKAVFPG